MHSSRWTILPLLALLLAQLSPAGICLLECRCEGPAAAEAKPSAASSAEHACCALVERPDGRGQWTATEPSADGEASEPCPRLCAVERSEPKATPSAAKTTSPTHAPPATLRVSIAPPAHSPLTERARRSPSAACNLHVSIPTTVLRT